MERAISTFAYHKPAQTGDPRNAGRWVEQQWERTIGDEPLPGEIQEMIGAARDGELPKPAAGLPEFPDPLEGL